MNRSAPSAGFPFESRYVDVLDSRMHYVDEGRGPVMLFLHGNPTSSYLWRNVLPHLVAHNRCIAPDLIGMGRSGKPALAYSFFDHVRYLDAFIAALRLERFTLVVHDWGSALGFHYARRHPQQVRAVAFMEALIEPQRWDTIVQPFRTGLRLIRTPVLGWILIVALNGFVRYILPRAMLRSLSPEERRRYAEPYPTWGSRRPLLAWPRCIPIGAHPADVVEAVRGYRHWLDHTSIPKLLLAATPGALIRQHDVEEARATMPNLEVVEVGSGIHYIQEDCPDAIGQALARWHGSLLHQESGQIADRNQPPSNR
jgi:haloalkane dehalogenase